MSPMPDHVVAYLIDAGVIAPGGISRRARPRTCPRCGRLTIAGLDHDRAALVATVDPTPLDPAAEATALLTGRATYALRFLDNAYCLDLRDLSAIRAHPAGQQPKIDTVAEHKCGQRITSTANSNLANIRQYQLPAECLF